MDEYSSEKVVATTSQLIWEYTHVSSKIETFVWIWWKHSPPPPFSRKKVALSFHREFTVDLPTFTVHAETRANLGVHERMYGTSDRKMNLRASDKTIPIWQSRHDAKDNNTFFTDNSWTQIVIM